MHFRVSFRGLALAALAASSACKDQSPESAGVPRNIRAVSSTALTVAVGSTIPDPLVVRVEDEQNRPVRGARVLFTVADGMATIAPEDAVTDARGEARTNVTIGQIAGRIDVTARLAGSDSSARFTITATALPASRVVVIPDPMWLDGVGVTGQLFGNVADQYGNGISGSTITWRSLDPTIASVTLDGIVAGLQSGVTGRIEGRSAEGFVDTVLISVADPATSPCTGAVVQLAPGDTVTMDSREGTCVRSAADAEYVAVSFFSTEAPNSQTELLHAVATGLKRAAAAPALSPAPSPVMGALRAAEAPRPDDEFHSRLRLREERELAPLAVRARGAMAGGAEMGALLNAVPGTVKVGDLVTINASPTYACSFPTDDARKQDTRVGRIAAITQKAIVVADTLNPAGGFTSDEYLELGRIFDTLVAPVNDRVFGTPNDIDGNQRSVIFYTGRVNQLSTSPDSYVGGYFWSRDLLPKSACSTGNVGEIFYMLVPDPNGQLGPARSKAFVRQVTVGTLGHEYQHLINASRRFADPQAEPAEATWLNEGLSHIAEELLFYHVSKLQPRSNLDFASFATDAVRQLYNLYQHNNVARLERWLLAPGSNTPYGLSSSLATRGAAWAYLRHLADRDGASDDDVWYQLVNSRTSGIANIEAVFGVEVKQSVRDWSVAMYADDLAANRAAAHDFPSWNLRAMYAQSGEAYPLATDWLVTNAEQVFALRGGGSAYFTFETTGGIDARVWVRTRRGSPQPPVKVTVLRVR
jgi:hypothetical protein